jgi:hypothetical protein
MQEKNRHVIKNDKYAKARGGNSHFLDLYCGQCRQHFALYQKDGGGALLRLYLDRIFEPQELSQLQLRCARKNDVPSLKCQCGLLIGTPMVYEPEQRLAFRLIRGTFTKKKSGGVYPPSKQNLNS